MMPAPRRSRHRQTEGVAVILLPPFIVAIWALGYWVPARSK